MSAYKVSEIKEMTNEELISTLVYNGIRMAHKFGRPTKAQLTNEDRIVIELSSRLGLDETKLLEQLNM